MHTVAVGALVGTLAGLASGAFDSALSYYEEIEATAKNPKVAESKLEKARCGDFIMTRKRAVYASEMQYCARTLERNKNEIVVV